MQLSWRASDETTFRAYTIQRSLDASTFIDRQTVLPKGTASGPADYTADDVLADDASRQRSGTFYYRLKMTDLDGSTSYSKIEAVTIDPQALYLSVAPNPVHDTIHGDVSIPDDALIELTLTDATGRSVQRQSLSARRGQNTFNLPVGTLAAGTYLLRASDGVRQVTERVLVH